MGIFICADNQNERVSRIPRGPGGLVLDLSSTRYFCLEVRYGTTVYAQGWPEDGL